jgi:hypothetical protein
VHFRGRLVLHSLPSLFGPGAQEEQRTEHDAKTGQAERDVSGASNTVHRVSFGAVVGDDICFDGAGDA